MLGRAWCLLLLTVQALRFTIVLPTTLTVLEPLNMPTRAILIGLLLMQSYSAAAQGTAGQGVRVEVVAAATEYAPSSITVSHPGHFYTNCMGTTSYFGRFSSYGDFGSIFGTAATNTSCKTTFAEPTETTLTTYRKVNYTIVESKQALHLLSCTQTWQPSARTRELAGVVGVSGAGGNDSAHAQEQTSLAPGSGHWSDCPAFAIGTTYTLIVSSPSDARLQESTTGQPTAGAKLEYLGSEAVPPSNNPNTPRGSVDVASQANSAAQLEMSSTPAGAEIQLDGSFVGDTPSTIGVSSGDHVIVLNKHGYAPWRRTVRVTNGRVTIAADMDAAPQNEPPSTPQQVAAPPSTPPLQTTAPQPRGQLQTTTQTSIPLPHRTTTNVAGTVSVTSNPDGAGVAVDYTLAGKTPITLGLPPGLHMISVLMTGYDYWVQTITVEAGAKLEVTATLTKSN